MDQLYIEYRHVPVGMPILKLCGLTLAERLIITCNNSGYERLCILVHEEDKNTLSEKLENKSSDSICICSTTPDSLSEESASHTPVIKGNFISNQSYLPETAQEDVQGGYWLDSVEDHKGAERYLLSGLTKKADGVISRHINRKISLWITRYLMNTSVKPNHVTATVFLVGVLSGPTILLLGGYLGLVLGAFLYWFAAVLDGCDGELSRLRHEGTKLGAWLDTVVDDLVGLSFILGLYCLLGSQGAFWQFTGVVAVCFYFLTLGPRYYVLAKYFGTGDYQVLSSQKVRKDPETTFQRIVQFTEETVVRTDFMPFAAMVTAILHGEKIFAFLFMLGCIGSAIDSFLVLRKMQRVRQSS